MARLATTPAAGPAQRLLDLYDSAVTSGLGGHLTADLGEVRGFAYYTGMIFTLMRLERAMRLAPEVATMSCSGDLAGRCRPLALVWISIGWENPFGRTVRRNLARFA